MALYALAVLGCGFIAIAALLAFLRLLGIVWDVGNGKKRAPYPSTPEHADAYVRELPRWSRNGP